MDNRHQSQTIVKVAVALLLLVVLIITLRQVFSGNWILPQTFSVGPLTIHYYGITMASAVGVGWWLAARRAPHYGIAPERVDTFLTWLAIAGFLGARLYHVASSYAYYLDNPADIIKIWHGGLSIYGAAIGGLFFIVASSFKTDALCPKNSGRRNSDTGVIQELLRRVDWLILSVPVGMIIGRFGNLFNYEAFGYPTNLPWGMFVPEVFRPLGLETHVFFHPLFLYEAIGNALIFMLLYRLFASKNASVTSQPGLLFFSYLFLYNILRFCIEQLRTDSTFIAHGFRLNAVVSGVVVLVSACVLARYYYGRKNITSVEKS